LVIENKQNKSTINFVHSPYFKNFTFYRDMYTLLFELEHSVQGKFMLFTLFTSLHSIYVINTVHFLTLNEDQHVLDLMILCCYYHTLRMAPWCRNM